MKFLLMFTLIIILSFYLIASTEDIKETKIAPVHQFGGLESDSKLQFYRPSDLTIINDNEIVVSDADDHSITILNNNGEILNKFGRLGQGPGDFNRPMKVDVFKENLIVYDGGNYRIQILTKSGELLETYHSLTLMQFGAKMWINKDGSYYFSTEGYNSINLIIHRSLEGSIINKYGNIFGEKTNFLKFYTEQIKKGIIPDSYKNKVFPIADSAGNVYCIHYSIPIIKKFNSNGELIWEKRINLPEFKTIKSRWIKINKEARPNLTYGLSYWRDVEIDERGNIYLLVYMKNMVIYKLDTEGIIITRYVGVKDNISLIDIYNNQLWAFGEDSHIFYQFYLNN